LADYDIVTRLSDLEALARDLMSESVIAVDTEADSFYHYFDKVCLVQVATRKNAWLIDPLALGGPEELAPLGPVFSSPDVRVLFHAAEYDIYVLKRDCGFTFQNLFDTMISAQLLGYPSIGLAALIEHHFGIKVPKDEQRSDWSRRPLSDKQLTYAVGDVLYLIKLADLLEKELRKAGRREWAQEEFDTLCGREWPEREFDTLGYLRIKGAKNLDPRSLAVLHQLYLLRDARARDVDRPPFKVLGNRALLEIAERKPKSLEELSAIKGVTDLIIRRMGSEILSAVKAGGKKAHGPIPKLEGSGRKRMDRRTERRLAALKKWRTPSAEAAGLDAGVLCPNAALEAIAWRNPQTADEVAEIPELKGWFVREFGSAIAEVMAATEAAGADEPEPAEDAAPKRKRRARRGGKRAARRRRGEGSGGGSER